MVSVPKALATAFCTHTTIIHAGDVYQTVHENTPGLVLPLSSIVGSGFEWIVHDVFRTSGGKPCFQKATSVNANILAVRSS